jgi:hypothetical protein
MNPIMVHHRGEFLIEHKISIITHGNNLFFTHKTYFCPNGLKFEVRDLRFIFLTCYSLVNIKLQTSNLKLK